MDQISDAVAVLASGGLDSSVLVCDLVHQRRQVQPIYIRSGLSWEPVELEFLRKYLKRLAAANLNELVVLDMPVRDLYGDHWSLTGQNVPDAASPDAAVYLPGRNLLLLLKAMLWCHLHAVPAIALAVLNGNPFADATEEFFAKFAAAVNEGVQGGLRIERPFTRWNKAEVLKKRGGQFLHLTLSCMQPSAGRHCGACNKCAERRQAFSDAGIQDPTPYK